MRIERLARGIRLLAMAAAGSHLLCNSPAVAAAVWKAHTLWGCAGPAKAYLTGKAATEDQARKAHNLCSGNNGNTQIVACQHPEAPLDGSNVAGTCSIRHRITDGDSFYWLNTTLNPVSYAVVCPAGQRFEQQPDACVPVVPRIADKPQPCAPRFGQPIFPLTGHKQSSVELGHWLGQSMSLTYDTRIRVGGGPSGEQLRGEPAASIGGLWQSSLHKRLVFRADSSRVIYASRGSGDWITFIRQTTGAYLPDLDIKDRLLPRSGGAGGWFYYDARKNRLETYDSLGRLLTEHAAEGTHLQISYSSGALQPMQGLIIAAQDSFGRAINLAYEQGGAQSAKPRLMRVIDPSRRDTLFGYDAASNLQRITWPDGTERSFVYEAPDLPWALTGVIDEAGVRHLSFGYDAAGRATSTQRALGVDRYLASWTSPPGWLVNEFYDPGAGVVWRDESWQSPQGTAVQRPDGSHSLLATSSLLGMPVLTSQSQAAGSGCAASASHQSYDANGNQSSRDDFNGNRVCYAYDLARNLEVARVEGLPGGAACTATAAGAALPFGARKTSTLWHPQWSVRTREAEPGRITSYVYNGQPDPIAGGTASCAPATAKLPDDSPIAVLCRRIEQATTDSDGSQGFSAPLQAGVAAREHRWTYNQFGQVLTHDGPLPGPADTTRYEYYTSTSLTGMDPYAVGYTLGDLRKITNPAGHVTLFTLYDKNGQWLQSLDPNGVVTTRAFDARQRLSMVSISGETTTYEYWPHGLLKKLTQPDGSFLSHEYDAAQRLIAVSDHLGNRIEYVLDNAGNRTAENVKDPGGGLRRALTRSFDALNRVQQVIGREVAP